MAEVKEEAQKAKPQKQLQKKQANPERPKHEYEDYLIFLHKKSRTPCGLQRDNP